MTIDWKTITTITVPAIVLMAGWLANDHLNRRRDRENKLRDLRISYLITAYRDLADSSQRQPTPNSFRKVESAFADVQLFGSKLQVSMVATALEEFSRTARAPLDPLLNDLRNELRKELDLESVSENVRYVRPEGTPVAEQK